MSEMRIYRHGRWYSCRPADNGVFYIHWSENRRSQRASTRTKDISAAQAFFEEWVKLVGADSGAAELTVGDLFDMKYPDPNERHAIIRAHLDETFLGLRPIEVTDALEARYRAARTRAGIRWSTIRHELSLLRAALNHGAKKRLVSADALPVLSPLAAPGPPRDRWLRDAEVEALLAAEAPERVHRFIWLALETGARRTAIQELTWSRVDFEQGVVHFLPEGEVQSRKRRASVPISKALRPRLEAWYGEGATGLVIGPGQRVNEALTRVAKAAGLEGVTPHVMRHTAATRMARRGVSLWLIAKVLGNTVEQVEKVYAKHSPEMLQGAVDAISGGAQDARSAQGERQT